jgi:hypothetical protein
MVKTIKAKNKIVFQEDSEIDIDVYWAYTSIGPINHKWLPVKKGYSFPAVIFCFTHADLSIICTNIKCDINHAIEQCPGKNLVILKHGTMDIEDTSDDLYNNFITGTLCVSLLAEKFTEEEEIVRDIIQ